MKDDEMTEYAKLAVANKNVLHGFTSDGRPTERLLFMPPHYLAVKKNSFVDSTGTLTWLPDKISHERDRTPIDLNGERIVKPAAAAAAGKTKKPKAAPIDRTKEKSSHDVKQMLQKATTSMVISTPSFAAAAALPGFVKSKKTHASNDGGSSSLGVQMDNLFGDAHVVNIADGLYPTKGVFTDTMQLLFIDWVDQEMMKGKDALKTMEKFTKALLEGAQQADTVRSPSDKLQMLKRACGQNLGSLLVVLPFFSEEARDYLNTAYNMFKTK